ncbi:MAG: hypothetical protein Q8907_15000 [Bacteroidota bacterium]|nr:hypothetical protein [Bacteroidota bacterium]MDP4275579.1 hypothetical protein [Bacteroidota bacterium]
MELNLDLLRNKKKSISAIILGLLILCFLVYAIIWSDMMPSSHYAPVFDGILYGLLFFTGIYFMISGFGYSVARLFGKAFIIIDKEKISIKANVFVKEQKVMWDDIKSISYSSNRYHIVKINDHRQMIDLSKFDYYLLKIIKDTVRSMAKEKGLIIFES